MKKEELNSFCRIIKNSQSTKDAYFLHGFTSSIDDQEPVAEKFAKEHPDYDVIQCNARGHGNRRDTSRLDWEGSIEDINEVIEERNRDAVLIGHSMGGTMAITLGIKNPHVKKVFGVSAIHGDTETVKQRLKKTQSIFDINDKDLEVCLDKVQSSFPANYEQCADENAKKFYLIHAKNDNLVPFSEFEKNKEDLCLPDENTLIYDNIISVSLGKADFPHVIPFYNGKTERFINAKLNE